MTKRASSDEVKSGDTVTYTLIYSNAGRERCDKCRRD